jgi:CRP/FNR family transcriptional regulator, cyclic AMP receptor protein
MATREDQADMLSKVPLFQGLSKKELDFVLRASKEANFQPGAEIVREGARGTGFHLILAGKATVVQGGRELRKIGPGESFGDIALIDGGVRTATVRVDEPVHTLSLVEWEFKPLLLEYPQLAHKLLLELCRRLRDAEARTNI